MLGLEARECRSRPTGDPISFDQPKEIGERKGYPLPLISFASAPHPGRLALLSLVASKQHWLLRTSNSARRISRIPARCKGATEGKGKPLVDRHSVQASAMKSRVLVELLDFSYSWDEERCCCLGFRVPYAAPSSGVKTADW